MSKAGERMIRSARQALAFAQGEKEHDCTVHIPKEINVRRIRRKADMSQSEFASYFGGERPYGAGLGTGQAGAVRGVASLSAGD